MHELLSDLEAAAVALPVDLPVQTDPLDESDAPCIVVERQKVSVGTTTSIQLGGSGASDVYVGFPSDTRWGDIEMVIGAFLAAYNEEAPATDIDAVTMGRGASGLKLVELSIETGIGLDLEPLPSDFTYSY